MKRSTEIRFIVGVLVWIGLSAFAWLLFRQLNSASPIATQQLVSYLGAQDQSIEISATEHIVLGVGDPVFVQISEDEYKPIGFVSRVDYPTPESGEPVRLAWTDGATLRFLSGAPRFSAGDYVTYHETDVSFAWIARTMFSPAKKEEIRSLIADALRVHQADLIREFQPLIEQTAREAVEAVRDELLVQLQQRKSDIQAIGKRYQSEILEKDLVPVFEEEVMPMVIDEIQPLAEKVGREIWQEVSVWRFGWRYIYDRTPLPKRDLAQKEFDRFVRDKATPIFNSHLNEVIEVQKEILAKISRNQRVTDALGEAVTKVVNDEQVKQLVGEIFQASIVENENLRTTIEATWKSPEAKAALKMVNETAEPTVTAIGQALFGSPREGVPPEFARVLRNRILHKDERWLILHLKSNSGTDSTTESAGAVSELPVVIADWPSEIPFSPVAAQPESADQPQGRPSGD